ncbi:MAG: hypothetical protein KatS3mg078_0316 [Deltaproteobacteria bacterium]|nr:MAG: hypothetical protein KatS3mg078_0316 [Deltaproteobacteria bacterium]
MRISKTVQETEGVRKAVVVMATDKAKFALESAGLLTPEIKEATGSDLVMVVEADSEELANRVIARMEELVSMNISKDTKRTSDLLNQKVTVINIGLEIFKEALEQQGVEVVHVDWQVPAGGDTRLVNILKKLY